ncbi:hypothetical protein Tco_0982568 [Tanacetum coccineum]
MIAWMGAAWILSDGLYHVVDFPEDDLAVEIEEGLEEDQDMDINEEDPEDDQVMDFKVEEWEDDEDWLIAPHIIYEVGGPSSAVPEASHPEGHPLSIVTSRDPLHHQELATLHVRLDRVESTQTELMRSERAIVRDIGWLGERDEVIQHMILSIVRRVDGLSDDRVANKISELRDIVDDYPHGQVDTLRHKEVKAENQDIRTRLSASESSERCMITCLLRMEDRINALEQRSSGLQGSNMPPKRLKRRAVERLVKKQVAEAIAEYERNKTDPENAGGSGPANAGGDNAPEVLGCSYKTFLNCKPHSFNRTKGVVRLSRWFEKMESVFEISKCAEEDKVKFAACTLEGRALTG